MATGTTLGAAGAVGVAALRGVWGALPADLGRLLPDMPARGHPLSLRGGAGSADAGREGPLAAGEGDGAMKYDEHRYDIRSMNRHASARRRRQWWRRDRRTFRQRITYWLPRLDLKGIK